jgi:MoxR-like ATPase
MTLDEAKDEFECRIEAVHPGTTARWALGASNGPFVLEGAFRFGLYNIDAPGYDDLIKYGRSLALATRIVSPTGNVLHLSMVFQGEGLVALKRRRDEISSIVKEGKANKVRVYLHSSGIYLAQLDFPSFADFPEEAGAPLFAQAAYFADIGHETSLDPVETVFVRYIGSLLGQTPLRRLGPQGAVAGGTALSPADIDFNELERKIKSLGAFYTRSLVERYHVALNHLSRKHFVLLTGISGTGKTRLAKAYAYALFGMTSLDLPLENFHLIPVRPDWTEPAHLLGFMDAISRTYQRTRFVDALVQAHHNPETPVFVCLDEMNLAQPEHYFADVLSAMETGEPIHLHSGRTSESGEVPGIIPWPDNLFIVGTVNVDETTRPFSPKVMDRANIIDMSEIDIRGFCQDLQVRDSMLASVLTGDFIARLEEIARPLVRHGLHFGYRAVEEMARYVLFSQGKGLLVDALDIQIEQKVLTKVRGGPEHRQMLDELFKALDGLPRARAVVERMRRDLTNYESFQYWG